ncbi:hypothetical protein Tco_0553461 [Tanacetum coccineum]
MQKLRFIAENTLRRSRGQENSESRELKRAMTKETLMSISLLTLDNPDELGIRSNLPAPRQVLSITSGRKRKIQELKPETRIPRLECNRILPEGIPFVNNMVIEEPEYGMFFIDVFDDEAFQRMSDIQ